MYFYNVFTYSDIQDFVGCFRNSQLYWGNALNAYKQRRNSFGIMSSRTLRLNMKDKRIKCKPFYRKIFIYEQIIPLLKITVLTTKLQKNSKLLLLCLYIECCMSHSGLSHEMDNSRPVTNERIGDIRLPPPSFITSLITEAYTWLVTSAGNKNVPDLSPIILRTVQSVCLDLVIKCFNSEVKWGVDPSCMNHYHIFLYNCDSL